MTDTGLNLVGASCGVAFLGHIISRRQFRSHGGKKRYQKRPTEGIRIDADMKELKAELRARKFMKGDGEPIPAGCNRFYHLPQSEANRRVNQILREYSIRFEYADNRIQVLTWVGYVLRHSLAKMYAAKYKLRSRAKVFRKAGGDLSKPLKAGEGLSPVGRSDGGLLKGDIRIPGILFYKRSSIPKADESPLAKGWQPEHEKILERIARKEQISEKDREEIADFVKTRVWSSSRDSMERQAWHNLAKK